MGPEFIALFTIPGVGWPGTRGSGRGLMEQKLVVHKKDGTVYKGITQDFDPGRDEFYFLPAEGGGIPMRMRVDDMKALFWVRDYLGNRQFVPRRAFDDADAQKQRAIVTFNDGEEVWGTLDEDTDNERGFFLIPADRDDNNLRIFVVRSAMKAVRMVS